jgi:large subunit ribosomal protein L35
MPKLKTNRAAAKRFRVTATGKLKHRKAFRSHILTKKANKRMRKLRKADYVDSTNVKQVKRLCPYI